MKGKHEAHGIDLVPLVLSGHRAVTDHCELGLGLPWLCGVHLLFIEGKGSLLLP
jgi:hypothetical protein